MADIGKRKRRIRVVPERVAPERPAEQPKPPEKEPAKTK